MKRLPLITCLLAILGILLMFPGCAEESKRPTTSASDALSDPFHYDPFKNDQNISGGGIGNFDKKAYQKDVDHVLLH